jgi:hypothetical protein
VCSDGCRIEKVWLIMGVLIGVLIWAVGTGDYWPATSMNLTFCSKLLEHILTLGTRD